MLYMSSTSVNSSPVHPMSQAERKNINERNMKNPILQTSLSAEHPSYNKSSIKDRISQSLSVLI